MCEEVDTGQCYGMGDACSYKWGAQGTVQFCPLDQSNQRVDKSSTTSSGDVNTPRTVQYDPSGALGG